MGLLLAIETSARTGSIALLRTAVAPTADELLGQMVLGAGQRHDEQLLAAIDALITQQGCAVADLTAVAFGAGPGSFTGVRLGAAAAQGIGWAIGIPVFGVSSVDALALGVTRRFPGVAVAVAVDARMSQVYWRWCDEDSSAYASCSLLDAAGFVALPMPAVPFIGAGDGWLTAVVTDAWRERAAQLIPDAVPHALDIATLAGQAWQSGARPPAGDAQPCYLVGADAWHRR